MNFLKKLTEEIVEIKGFRGYFGDNGVILGGDNGVLDIMELFSI